MKISAIISHARRAHFISHHSIHAVREKFCRDEWVISVEASQACTNQPWGGNILNNGTGNVKGRRRTECVQCESEGCPVDLRVVTQEDVQGVNRWEQETLADSTFNTVIQLSRDAEPEGRY